MLLFAYNCQLPSNPCITLGPLNPIFYYRARKAELGSILLAFTAG